MIKQIPGRSCCLLLLLQLYMLFLLSGCSIKKIALGSIADALDSGTGSSFASDDDVDLIGQALPFGLKTMESLLKEVPEHKGLHLSLAKGFVLYAYAFVETKAENAKNTDFTEYRKLRLRAGRLYYRAYQYGLKGLALSDGKDVGLLYWTGAALAKWITVSKNDPSAIIRISEAVEFMQRALEIDSEYDNGAIHEFFVSYECRQGIKGDTAKAMFHYRKALKASQGKKASVYLTYIETFAIPNQNKKEFRQYIHKILDFDIDKWPEYRLANAITKQRAEFLLEKEEYLFLGE